MVGSACYTAATDKIAFLQITDAGAVATLGRLMTITPVTPTKSVTLRS